MATYFENLVTARDKLAQVLAEEMTRVAVLTAAGHPPPTTYSVGGRSVDWNGWRAGVVDQLDKMNDLIVKTGADGGLVDEFVRVY